MSERWSERTWRPFGRENPYYGVCSDERFRGSHLNPDALREFFESGEQHVAWVMSAIHRLIAPSFAPSRVLDFGCGVGRLVLPFARMADEVVGADVSPEMLQEAERNAAAAGLANVRLVRVGETTDAIDGQFDLIHSFIVFQHIPPAHGERTAFRLAGMLRPGGVGALHFTYGRAAPLSRKAVHALRKHVPGVNAVVNLARGQSMREPFIPMYRYRLERLADGFRRANCSEIHLLLTDHGGHLGAMMLFQAG